MNTVIMACESLTQHVKAAQKKMHTCYPVVELDSSLHSVPEKMRAAVFSTMADLPEEVDTVLVSMGLCGGSLSETVFPKRAVIPRVDDCITLLMHVDDVWFPNLKQTGHLYLTDTVDGRLSVENIQKRLFERYGEKRGRMVFEMWFEHYNNMDIIDTGVYDSYAPAYLEKARRNADLINSSLCHVPGSNLLLEKLVSGRWDHQFIVAEKGKTLTATDFV